MEPFPETELNKFELPLPVQIWITDLNPSWIFNSESVVQFEPAVGGSATQLKFVKFLF